MTDLHAALSEYLHTRRTLGTQLKWPESCLRQFVELVIAQGGDVVTTALALRWTFQPIGLQPATYARRLGLVRAFACWLHASDPRTEIPPPRLLPAPHRRPTPHIYSHDEILALMAAASQRDGDGLQGATFATLIGLLAATGLRPGEALKLDVDDVDLRDHVLTIQGSKGGKSRLVPFTPSTGVALAQYAERRDRLVPNPSTPAFLVTANGTRVPGDRARRTFARLCQHVGLRPRQPKRSGRGPRLQDLRHTFATHQLIAWYRAGVDVNRQLPQLATYLGHGSPSETYWYIQAVPELLALASERVMAPEGGDRPSMPWT
ncbi:tyrosine-type recombinase/integrase [Thiorhodococcus minor]|uniref:Tyrosine-type recombinase/integrase n=1 Tax=Thiorhodococcus minor TaxID=57489 RepID=A0A6M0K2V2_9GAMM|nr:tyrosine-type recombinase/integrase [Thiorhodococcus minor]NEV62917.1 tyrosine-type recombinase/integrase [Thiorhodococcus minor]